MITTRFAVLVLVTAACGKGGKDAGIEIFGKKPVPPGDLAKVKPGMTQAEFKAAFPSARPTPNHSGSPSLRIESGYSNVDYDVVFYSDKDAVAHVDIGVPKDLAAKLPTVWGPPTKDVMGNTWTNNDNGYNVTAMEMGRKTDVAFRPFVPLTAAYFGKAPALPGNWKDVKLGAKQADVKPTTNEEPGDVSIEPRYSDGELADIRVRLPAHAPKIIEAAWGPGTKTDDSTSWFNDAAGIRATLAGEQLLFEPYITYAKLFGTGPADMGQVPVKLAGKSKADFIAALGPKAAVADNVMLSYGMTKHGGQYAHVNCLHSCTLTIPYETNTAARDEMLAYLVSIWGTPKVDKDTRRFKVGGKTIVVDDWGGTLRIEVETK